MTQEEAIKQALVKAGSDSAFKSALLGNPHAVLSREFPQVDFSKDIQLDMELSDDDLDNVSGGWGGDGEAGGGSGTEGGEGGEGGDTGSGGDSGSSGCHRGLGVGNDGTKGQGKGQGQNNGGGLGLQTDFKGN